MAQTSMDDYRDFEVDVRRYARTVLPKEINEFKQKVAFQVLNGLVMLTRVDTGRARGGWQVTLAIPAIGESGTLDKNGSSTVEREAIRVLESRYGEDIYITNNVHYIVWLNYGTTTREGDHFVERVLADVESQFEAA